MNLSAPATIRNFTELEKLTVKNHQQNKTPDLHPEFLVFMVNEISFMKKNNVMFYITNMQHKN